jgi:hypothetical protein
MLRSDIQSVDGSSWAAGVYIVQLSGEEGNRNLRLIKE